MMGPPSGCSALIRQVAPMALLLLSLCSTQAESRSLQNLSEILNHTSEVISVLCQATSSG